VTTFDFRNGAVSPGDLRNRGLAVLCFPIRVVLDLKLLNLAPAGTPQEE